jgi:hypothetical protein
MVAKLEALKIWRALIFSTENAWTCLSFDCVVIDDLGVAFDHYVHAIWNLAFLNHKLRVLRNFDLANNRQNHHNIGTCIVVRVVLFALLDLRLEKDVQMRARLQLAL